MTSIEQLAEFVASRSNRRAANVSGHWHNLQIRPDLGSGEVLNVGVAFVDAAQIVHLKLADDLSRLTCLYDHRVDVASFERLCAVIQGAYDGSPLEAFNLNPLSNQTTLSAGRYAAGSSIQEILDSFFDATVPLAQPRSQPLFSKAQRAKVVSTADAQQRVIKELIIRMGARAVPFIAQSPWLVTEEGRERKINVPFRAPGKLSATVVSVWTKDRYRRKYQLSEAGLDLDIVQSYAPDEKLGLFVMRPMVDQSYSSTELEEIDGEIDEAAWKLRKLANVSVETGSNAGEISGKLQDWLLAA